MKTAYLSALALVGAVAYSSAADCDMGLIESKLYPNATQGLADCQNATGIDIFAVGQFPTTEQVTQLSENVDCADYLNQINQVANAEIQCNVTIEGVPINFGKLIADFLTGKTGNESDSGSGSIEIPSDSASGSMPSGSADLESSAASSESKASSESTGSNGASGAQALSFVAYCVAATVALALHRLPPPSTMKISLPALALISLISVVVTATECDLAAIRTTLSTGVKTNTICFADNEEKCLEDSGYDIFDISTFPRLEEAQAAQESVACCNLVNLVNGQVIIDNQCSLRLNGTTITYGFLISSFINGKTGNELDGSSELGLPGKGLLLSSSEESNITSIRSTSTATYYEVQHSDITNEASRLVCDALVGMPLAEWSPSYPADTDLLVLFFDGPLEGSKAVLFQAGVGSYLDNQRI
ncbi:unnamed protein product [Phytophthora lilii]|uniref:Unnamed protein product n=1 Tax=Phytophthora lilii TaxID=2077276 RepID=A0A9W6T8G1_9STRA|nr:unnamed protein product [Phytophthora lilii]